MNKNNELELLLNLASLEELEYLADFNNNNYYEDTKEINQYLYEVFYKDSHYYKVK